MRTTISRVMLAIVVCAFCAQTEGARFFLSTNDVGREDFLAEIGPGFTGQMYILASLEPGESIPAMGISLHTDNASVFTVTNPVLLNPVSLLTAEPRWNETSFTEGSGNTLIGELFGIQVGGGLRQDRFLIADMLNDPTFNRDTGVAQVASFDLEVTGTGVGQLWLSAGPNGLPVQPTAPDQGDLVGFGDDFAPNNLFGPSGNPDSIIPEPASILLFTPAVTMLLRRRSVHQPR